MKNSLVLPFGSDTRPLWIPAALPPENHGPPESPSAAVVFAMKIMCLKERPELEKAPLVFSTSLHDLEFQPQPK